MKEIQFQKYNRRGSDYHWQQISRSLRKRNVYVVARYKIIEDLIGEEISGKKLLDVGCGDGVLSYLLAKKGAQVTGIDSSDEAIKFAKGKNKKHKNINFLTASAYHLPFDNQTFDYIVSSDVIEHLANPEQMLLEMKRVWNSNGKIVITTPIKLTKEPLDKMHYQEYFEEDFRRLLNKYFKEVKIIKSHPLFWMEFQNKVIFRHSLNKVFLNALNLLAGFNPFISNKRWRYYTLQTAVISK